MSTADGELPGCFWQIAESSLGPSWWCARFGSMSSRRSACRSGQPQRLSGCRRRWVGGAYPYPHAVSETCDTHRTDRRKRESGRHKEVPDREGVSMHAHRSDLNRSAPCPIVAVALSKKQNCAYMLWLVKMHLRLPKHTHPHAVQSIRARRRECQGTSACDSQRWAADARGAALK